MYAGLQTGKPVAVANKRRSAARLIDNADIRDDFEHGMNVPPRLTSVYTIGEISPEGVDGPRSCYYSHSVGYCGGNLFVRRPSRKRGRKQHGDTGDVIRYSNKFKRATAMFMAVWFFASAGLVHSLHHHSSVLCTGSESNSITALQCSSMPDSGPGTTRLADDGTPELDKHGSLGYCVACLLVNTCNAGAVEWTFEPQNHIADDLRFRGTESAYFSHDITRQPSRAPPVPIS